MLHLTSYLFLIKIREFYWELKFNELFLIKIREKNVCSHHFYLEFY